MGGSGADIDTLLIAPRHIERTDFFASFHDLLMNEKRITNIRAVPDAFVPVMKIEYEGIEVCVVIIIASTSCDISGAFPISVLDGLALFSFSAGCHP